MRIDTDDPVISWFLGLGVVLGGFLLIPALGWLLVPLIVRLYELILGT